MGNQLLSHSGAALALALISTACSPHIFSKSPTQNSLSAIRLGFGAGPEGTISLTYNKSWDALQINQLTPPLVPIVSGGGPSFSFSVAPALPAGLSLDPTTGQISGTPTVITPEVTYTVTASSAAGTASASLALKVMAGFVINSALDEGDANAGDGICSSTPSGFCTLRAAIEESNAGGISRAIRLPNGNYNLGSELNIMPPGVAILGQSPSGTIISGQNATRAFFISAGARGEFSNLTIRDGNTAVSPGGGAIAYSNANNTVLRISHVQFINNRSTTGVGGGAIALGTSGPVAGTSADIEFSDFISNSAPTVGGIGGGAITAHTGTLSIRFSQFMNNSNTAIAIGTTASIDHSTFANNTGDVGGAASIMSGGIPTFRNVTFYRNQATQAGGAVHVYDQRASFVNCTFVGNQAGTGGGAVSVSNGTPQASFVNSIVVGNSSTSGNPNCAPNFATQFISNGNNVSDSSDCSIGTGPADRPSVAAASIALGPLQNNGGYVQTMAPGPTSIAIDSAASASCPTIDARGFNRPAACDIGAFER